MLSKKILFQYIYSKKKNPGENYLFFNRKIIVGLNNLADFDRPIFYSGYRKNFFPEA
jgi:hypothetical protein